MTSIAETPDFERIHAELAEVVADPTLAAMIGLVGRGTAFFVGKARELSEAELREPSLLPDWSRAHVVAHVAYNALALERLTQWAATGVETPMYESFEKRNGEIERGATLPADELRDLTVTAANKLAAGWRELSKEAWANEVRAGQGRIVPASETAWMRSREVWLHAIDLGSGASAADLPEEFVDRLLPEVAKLWRVRGDDVPNLVLHPTDRSDGDIVLGEGRDGLSGPASQLLAWALGRPYDDLALQSGGDIPTAPRWL